MIDIKQNIKYLILIGILGFILLCTIICSGVKNDKILDPKVYEKIIRPNGTIKYMVE